MGALDFLDQKRTPANMEVVAYLPGSTISGGEPLMACGRAAGNGCSPPTEVLSIQWPKKPVVMNRGLTMVPGRRVT
jgi:hypothetical protein